MHQKRTKLRQKSKLLRQLPLLKQTPLTTAGPAVRNLVLKATGKTLIERLEHLGRLIAKIPVYSVDEKTLKRSYACRSAEQVLRDNAIYAVNPAKTRLKIFGCVDNTHIALACLRSMGVESAFIRYQGHSRVLLRIDSDYYFFDPSITRICKKSCLVKLDPQKNSTFKTLLREGRVLFGEDAKAVGLSFDLMKRNISID